MSAVAASSIAARRPLVRPGWIVAGLFTAFPLWWALGFGSFAWGLAAIPLAVWAITRPTALLRPPTFGLLAVFIFWALLSAHQLGQASRLLSYGYRTIIYFTVAGLLLYVWNERRVTRDRFVELVAWLWVATVIGGWLGLLFPNAQIRQTVASTLLPGALTSSEFVSELVRPGFAQVQTFLGFAVPRPKTLYEYTNEWGGNLALLTPFFVHAWLRSASARRRQAGWILAGVAVVPIVVSLNRGLWICLALLTVYLAVRGAIAGDPRALRVPVFGGLVIALVLVSPLGNLINDRLSGPSGDDARAGIYSQAWEGALERPVLGWGSPRPGTSFSKPISPPIGTHGQAWLVMFSQGLAGLAIYAAWFLTALVLALRRRDPLGVLMGGVLVMAIPQHFIYNLIPTSLCIVAVALAIALRPDDSAGPVEARA